TMRNVLDIFHWPQHGWQRAVAVAMTVGLPLIITFAGFGGFVSALSYAGGIAGVVMSIIPVMLLHAGRTHGDRSPQWSLGCTAPPLLQPPIIVVDGLPFLYSVGSILGIVLARCE